MVLTGKLTEDHTRGWGCGEVNPQLLHPCPTLIAQRSSKTREKVRSLRSDSLSLTAKHEACLTGPANPDFWQYKLFLTAGHLKARPHFDFKIDICTLFNIVLYHVCLCPEQMDTRCGFADVNRGLNWSQPFWKLLCSRVSTPPWGGSV